MAGDEKDTQLLSEIRKYFRDTYKLDLTDEQLLECHQSLISLGHAIARWRGISYDKLSSST